MNLLARLRVLLCITTLSHLALMWSLWVSLGAASVAPGWEIMDRVVNREVWPWVWGFVAVLALAAVRFKPLMPLAFWYPAIVTLLWSIATFLAWGDYGPQPGAFFLLSVACMKGFIGDLCTRWDAHEEALRRLVQEVTEHGME